MKSGVLIVGMKDPDGEKVMLLASVSPDLVKRVNAANILKEIAPMIDGRGAESLRWLRRRNENVGAPEGI